MEEESKRPEFTSLIPEKVSTSQDPRSTKSVGYQPPLPHDLSLYSVEIRKDASHIFHANLINQHISCHPATQSLGEISKISIKIYINGSDPPSPIFRRIQGIQRSQPTLLFRLSYYRIQQMKEQGATVVVKNRPSVRC